MPRVAKKTSVKKSPAKKSAPAKKKAITAATEFDINQFLKTSTTAAEKEMKAAKKSFETIKSKVAKLSAKKKAAKDKRVVVANKVKAKPTAAAKAQLERAKTAYQAISDDFSALSSELKAQREALSSLKLELAKTKGMAKAISKFEKSWEQKNSKKTPAKKSKAKKNSSKKSPEVVIEGLENVSTAAELVEALLD